MKYEYIRNDCIPVVWRNTIKEKLNRTIFGETVLTVKKCNTCHEYQPVVNFYLSSKTKKFQSESIRNQCCKCWDKYHGRTNLEEKIEDFPLDNFY
jgi:hypothetical protein